MAHRGQSIMVTVHHGGKGLVAGAQSQQSGSRERRMNAGSSLPFSFHSAGALPYGRGHLYIGGLPHLS